MKAYTRHFVSQHLGKATATVQFDNKAAGHVRIEVPALPDKTIVFTFQMARVKQAVPDPVQWHEMITRIAIYQLHRQLANKGRHALDGPARELMMGTSRWLGDLDEAPYGGATEGYSERERRAR